MQYLCIENSGEIDPRGLSLLGASVKEGGDSIGMFGSGTKYSLATLLRNHMVPRIFTGSQEIVIGTVPAKFRDKNFEIITIDGRETSLTTDTGLKWRIDQCVREFYSNALDEGNASASKTHEVIGKPGTTRVFIPINHSISEMCANWDQYFLNSSARPIAHKNKNAIFDIAETNNTHCVFRRGVWCVEKWGLHAVFSYDFHNVDLPETRLTEQAAVLYTAPYILKELHSERHIALLFEQVTNPDSFEWSGLSYLGRHEAPTQFMDHFKLHWDWVAVYRDLQYFPSSLHDRILVCCERTARTLKTWGAKDIRDYRNSDILYTELRWPIGYSDRVHAVIKRLNKNGIEFPWPIKYVQFPKGEEHTTAIADSKTKQCLLGQQAFESYDDKVLTKALIEEWTHLEFNVGDGSVDQQHVYLDTIIRLMK